MTRRPTTDAETDAAINEFQDRAYTRTPDDEADETTRAENRFEGSHVYGDHHRDWYGDHSTAPVIDPADEADLIRQLRADARRILGGAA